MSYVNSKHKIRTIFTAAQQNTSDLEVLTTSNDRASETLKNINIPKFNFSKLHDLSLDWEDTSVFSIQKLQSVNLTDGSYIVSNQYVAYKEWKLEIDNIPEKYLPFLDYKIEVQINPLLELTNNFQTSSILQLISEKDGNYDVELIVGCSTGFSNAEVALKTRLLVKVHNPEIYR